MTLQAAIANAIEAARPVLDPAPLTEAAAQLAAPWRVAVVGRTSVGKSTLVNWLAGAEASPVGMGGITTEPVEVEVGDRVLVDTPGIDDPDAALLTLGPILDHVDGVIWVIDGLQPLTASERRVADLTLPDGGRLELVIAKADLLEPNERQGVVERVRSLAEPWGPVSQRALDLRAAVRDRLDPGDLSRAHLPGPRRQRAVRAALTTLREQLHALPPAPGLDDVLQSWRDAVRSASAEVEAEISEGTVRNKTDAMASLAMRSGSASQHVQQTLGAHPAPSLPSLAVPDRTPFGQVISGMSGREGARRVLRAGAARWLAEGVVALQDWAEDQDALWQTHRERTAALEALDALEDAL